MNEHPDYAVRLLLRRLAQGRVATRMAAQPSASPGSPLIGGTASEVYATDADLATHAAAADPHTAYIPKVLVDAKGDLIAATAADTVARLAVGANGTVLTADSAEASGMKWAVGGGGAHAATHAGAGSDPVTSLGAITFSGAITPTTDAGQDVGSAALRWGVGRFSTAVSIGANAAAAGALRMQNTGYISGRNAANTGDITIMQLWSDNKLYFGVSTGDAGLVLRSGVKVEVLATVLTVNNAIAVGTTPATSGAIRIPNATALSARNAANSADVQVIGLTAGNALATGVAVTALGGGVAPTLGTIGGSGPAAAAQNSWLRIDIGGVASYIPVWR